MARVNIYRRQVRHYQGGIYTEPKCFRSLLLFYFVQLALASLGFAQGLRAFQTDAESLVLWCRSTKKISPALA